MPSVTECFDSFIYTITAINFRISVMFILTIVTATFEIICGIRAHANSLIADGLYSFAEGVCLIGVMLVLHYSRNVKHRQKSNTFGYERLELLFGLVQEVFLLSISLGIIVDAINHIANPTHVHDPMLMIILGGTGVFIGILGTLMFWGYHHTHNVKEEINKSKERNSLASAINTVKVEGKSLIQSNKNAVAETPLMTEPSKGETNDQSNQNIYMKKMPQFAQQQSSILDTFTYENVDIHESKIYATLHAICLHSFVVLLESVIVVLSGVTIKFVPYVDPVTGKEINVWLKYIDPLLTLMMVVIVAIRSVPVIFSISKILIENVPAGIDTEKLMKEIVAAVPAIKSIHSLHVWRATADEIYATLHLVCVEDINLSTCTHKYGQDIQNVLKIYCIRYFTLQFEYAVPNESDILPNYRCAYGLHRKRRGHTLDKPITSLAKEALLHI